MIAYIMLKKIFITIYLIILNSLPKNSLAG